jgi:hypothetical protein
MAADSQTATLRSNLTQGNNQVRASFQGVNAVTATVEVTAAADANSIYTMMRIPASARIMFPSTVAFDDLASSGSPTLDIGLKAVDGNITTDPDALNDGIGVSAAAGTANVVKDIANYGKEAWEFVSGQTTEPDGFLDVIITLADAAANTGGTATLTLYYTLD